jgi:hypothetical protein
VISSDNVHSEVMLSLILKGRDFAPADNAGIAATFIVSETFAARYLEGEAPLGKRISVVMANENPFGEIVGVAGDVKEGALDKNPMTTVYYIRSHLPNTGMGTKGFRSNPIATFVASLSHPP